MGKVIIINFLVLTQDPIRFNSTILFTNCCISYVFNIYLSCKSGLIVKESLNHFTVIIIQ